LNTNMNNKCAHNTKMQLFSPNCFIHQTNFDGRASIEKILIKIMFKMNSKVIELIRLIMDAFYNIQ